MTTECVQVPEDPKDGQVFRCPNCGYTCTFVVLYDEIPGQWVS